MMPEVMHSATQLAAPVGVDLLRLEGLCRGSDQPLTAIYAGNGLNRQYLEGLLFERVDATRIGKLALPLTLPARLHGLGQGVDLVLTDLPPLWSPFAGTAQIRLPAWIRQQLLLPESGPHLSRHLEKEVDRCARKHDYSVRYSSSVADGEYFYDDLYAPYISGRFGTGAYIVPRERFLQRVAGNTIAQLFDGDRWIAGMLLYREGDSLRFGWFGCRTNPPPSGASMVLDAECIRLAQRAGARRVVMGSSRPSLTDGSTRYKAKFGARIVPTRLPAPVLSIKIRNWSGALAQCIERHALVRLRGRELVVFRVLSDATSHRLSLEPACPGRVAR